MDIKERYSLVEGINYLSLKPYRSQLLLSRWFLAGIIMGGLILLFFRNSFRETHFLCLSALIVYGIFHSLYDILIRANIEFTFDGANHAIYRKIPYFGQREILQLNEMIIFTSAVTASWRYAIGAKKSHFIKSYGISEYFSVGKASRYRQQAYEGEILCKIHQIIAKSS